MEKDNKKRGLWTIFDKICGYSLIFLRTLIILTIAFISVFVGGDKK
jgi:hypothetical protein